MMIVYIRPIFKVITVFKKTIMDNPIVIFFQGKLSLDSMLSQRNLWLLEKRQCSCLIKTSAVTKCLLACIQYESSLLFEGMVNFPTHRSTFPIYLIY